MAAGELEFERRHPRLYNISRVYLQNHAKASVDVSTIDNADKVNASFPTAVVKDFNFDVFKKYHKKLFPDKNGTRLFQNRTNIKFMAAEGLANTMTLQLPSEHGVVAREAVIVTSAPVGSDSLRVFGYIPDETSGTADTFTFLINETTNTVSADWSE